MNIYYHLEDIPTSLTQNVVTIGSFDGVHRGHQRILQQVYQTAKADNKDLPRTVVTFEPHPRLVLPATTPQNIALLTTLTEKAFWLERYGIENLIVVPFTLDFANQSAEAYIRDFLVKHLSPSHIIIGYDHRFGHKRTGDINYLRLMSQKYGYTVQEIPAQDIDNIKISSSEIRDALRNGDARRATHLLGHTFQLSGEVVHGQQIGRTIGFPTANLDFSTQPHKLIPKCGIYSATVHINNRNYKGMLYIGRRPTVSPALPPTVEINIFDFRQDIYGAHISIDVLHFLRPESKFDSLEDLRKQLQNDKLAAISSLKDIKF